MTRLNQASRVYLGSSEVQRVYAGENLAWRKITPFSYREGGSSAVANLDSYSWPNPNNTLGLSDGVTGNVVPASLAARTSGIRLSMPSIGPEPEPGWTAELRFFYEYTWPGGGTSWCRVAYDLGGGSEITLNERGSQAFNGLTNPEVFNMSSLTWSQLSSLRPIVRTFLAAGTSSRYVALDAIELVIEGQREG